MKSFLSRLVGRLDIDSGNTRVGLVTYTSIVRTGFNLNAHSSVAAVQSAITSLSQSRGHTNTAAVLAYVRTAMLTLEAGDRRNVPNIVVILTDGQSVNITAMQVCSKQTNFLRKLLRVCPRPVLSIGGSVKEQSRWNRFISLSVFELCRSTRQTDRRTDGQLPHTTRSFSLTAQHGKQLKLLHFILDTLVTLISFTLSYASLLI